MLRVGNVYLRISDIERITVIDRAMHVKIYGRDTPFIMETNMDGAALHAHAASIMRQITKAPSASVRPTLPERLTARTATPTRPVPQAARRAATANPSATARPSAFGPTHFRDSAARMVKTAGEAQRNAAAAIGGAMLAGMD